MKVILILGMIGLVGCQSIQKLRDDMYDPNLKAKTEKENAEKAKHDAEIALKDGENKKEYVDVISISPEMAYTRARAWAGKTFSNVNNARLLDDSKTNHFVFEPTLYCIMPDGTRELKMNFEFEAKKGKTRITFDNIRAGFNEYPKTKPQMDQIIEHCLDRQHKEILKEYGRADF